MNRSIASASAILLLLVSSVWLVSTSAQTEKPGDAAVDPDQKGPAPRENKLNEKAQKVVLSQKKQPSPAEVIRRKLNAPMGSWRATPMHLGQTLTKLEEFAGFPKFVVNKNSFKEENPDAPDLDQIEINLADVQGLPNAKVLRMILDQIPSANASFLVRPGYVEILTNERSLPEAQFVEGNYENVPLSEVLSDLADQTGVTILVDARARDKGETAITARLQPETNLATAVRVMADMAGLKVLSVDRSLYVTLRSNEATFPPGRLPGGARQRAVEAAQAGEDSRSMHLSPLERLSRSNVIH